jgi:hypothetical protein
MFTVRDGKLYPDGKCAGRAPVVKVRLLPLVIVLPVCTCAYRVCREDGSIPAT